MILINSGKVSTMTSLHISCTLYLYSLLLGFQLHRNILEFLILASTSYTLSHFPFFVSSVLYPSNLFSFIFQPSWSMHLVFQGILFSSIFFIILLVIFLLHLTSVIHWPVYMCEAENVEINAAVLTSIVRHVNTSPDFHSMQLRGNSPKTWFRWLTLINHHPVHPSIIHKFICFWEGN